MKFDCEVLSVEGNGELLTMRLQGSGKNAALWRTMSVFSIQISETPRNRKAFHLGRRVSLTIEAK